MAGIKARPRPYTVADIGDGLVTVNPRFDDFRFSAFDCDACQFGCTLGQSFSLLFWQTGALAAVSPIVLIVLAAFPGFADHSVSCCWAVGLWVVGWNKRDEN